MKKYDKNMKKYKINMKKYEINMKLTLVFGLDPNRLPDNAKSLKILRFCETDPLESLKILWFWEPKLAESL